jgi:hypothetical protein
LPEALRVGSERYSNNWRIVNTLDGFGLDRKLRALGWNFFFMAQQNKVIAFGSGGEKTIAKAVERLLAKVKPQTFNAVEITEIIARRFLGIPYLTLSAHARHIQMGPYLEARAQREQGRRDAEWARA